MLVLGLAAGVAASFWASRFLSTLLYDLTPRDAATFLAAASLLAVVSAIAGGVPAWRASRIDPASVLREI
jgi:ABC-type lipoprotein release transport system permease subunit